MSADQFALLTIFVNVLSVLALLITVVIMARQGQEMRRSTFAAAWKALYDILQADEIRMARRLVMAELRHKDLSNWSTQDKLTAEKVCQSFDNAGFMVRKGMVPADFLVERRRKSLCDTWDVVGKLVES